ncbi:MAG TPA: hypothetical protein ENH11_01215 [Candidatus Acetothermia bacterium]|nr:hypothetical protein [Candidatus Acetothermia bacterium]
MAYNFLAYDEQQLYLLPASIVEWVKDDSLARFVGETVDLLDRRDQLQGFYAGYRKDGWGHPAYHPRMLVKVLASISTAGGYVSACGFKSPWDGDFRSPLLTIYAI